MAKVKGQDELTVEAIQAFADLEKMDEPYLIREGHVYIKAGTSLTNEEIRRLAAKLS